MQSAEQQGRSERAASDGDDALPRRFGRYLLFDRIGRGGMADIYLAQSESEFGAARRVVVKQILRELSRDPEFSQMLIDEAKMVAGLSHANIAQVLDLGREGERLFITMEYVEGYDLHQLLRQLSRRRIPLPAEFAIHTVREVLAGLDFAHRRRDADGSSLGIVHRDVSPSNVLISFEGEVKLCDFGIAKAFGLANPARRGGDPEQIAGKAAYMSPEQARGSEVDQRSDVFSAGIILYELCAGRRLYKGSEQEMLTKARAADIPPLPDGRLPEQEGIAAILERALRPNPDERYATASEMLRELDEYAMGARLMASQLRFASFLTEHFEEDVVRTRRARERSAGEAFSAMDASEAGGGTTPAAPTPTPEVELSPPSDGASSREPTPEPPAASTEEAVVSRQGWPWLWPLAALLAVAFVFAALVYFLPI